MAMSDPKSFRRRFKGEKWHVKRHGLRACTTAELSVDARFTFLAVGLDSQQTPGINLASTPKDARALRFFFCRK
jgi:hypothetical protein